MKFLVLIPLIINLLTLCEAVKQRKCFAPVYCDHGDNTGRPEWLQVFPPTKCHWSQSGNQTHKATKKVKPDKKITDEIKKDLEIQKKTSIELNVKYEDLANTVTANDAKYEKLATNVSANNEKYYELATNVSANNEKYYELATNVSANNEKYYELATNVSANNEKYYELATNVSANHEKYYELATNVSANNEKYYELATNVSANHEKYYELGTNVTVNREMYEELVLNYTASKEEIRDLTTNIGGINQQLKELQNTVRIIDLLIPYKCSGKGETETIYPWKNEGDLKPINGNCDLYSMNEDGWITIQKRFNGSVRFYDRNWDNYARGFGEKDGEFWLGLRTIHQLTTTKNYKLRINLGYRDGRQKYAEYSTFKVGSEEEKFQLTISGFSGDDVDRLDYHNGQYFTTVGADNDEWHGNCAQSFHGAWWHKSCYHSNLNGKYNSDFQWNGALTSSEMKIHLV